MLGFEWRMFKRLGCREAHRWIREILPHYRVPVHGSPQAPGLQRGLQRVYSSVSQRVIILIITSWLPLIADNM